MKAIATELATIISNYLPELKKLTAKELAYKPLPSKWSKKEIIGHLIDSAQNNIRRFIVAQYEESPTIVYNQDKWVSINNYQESDTSELIDLWYLLNKQAVFILMNTPHDLAKRYCNTSSAFTIEWLATDYIKHLRHHLHQVLNLEPINYP